MNTSLLNELGFFLSGLIVGAWFVFALISRQMWNARRIAKDKDLLQKVRKIVRDPKGRYAKDMKLHLTINDMEGLYDLDRTAQVLFLPGEELKNDLKELRERLGKITIID